MATNGQVVGGGTGCTEQVSVIGKMIVESQTLDQDGKEMVSGFIHNLCLSDCVVLQ